MKNYQFWADTKSNKVSIINVPEYEYIFYMVRAVDKYGRKGAFSTEVQATEGPTPSEVEGLR